MELGTTVQSVAKRRPRVVVMRRGGLDTICWKVSATGSQGCDTGTPIHCGDRVLSPITVEAERSKTMASRLSSLQCCQLWWFNDNTPIDT